MMRKLTLLCLQTYHLVAKLKLQILFVVQSNGKRGICDVENFGRTLDIDKLSLSFVFIFLSFVYLAIPVFASTSRSLIWPWEYCNSGRHPCTNYPCRLPSDSARSYHTICVVPISWLSKSLLRLPKHSMILLPSGLSSCMKQPLHVGTLLRSMWCQTLDTIALAYYRDSRRIVCFTKTGSILRSPSIWSRSNSLTDRIHKALPLFDHEIIL